jgi:hypothetical protein
VSRLMSGTVYAEAPKLITKLLILSEGRRGDSTVKVNSSNHAASCKGLTKKRGKFGFEIGPICYRDYESIIKNG